MPAPRIGSGLVGSATELAVLDYAIALAENRCRFPALDTVNARPVADAALHASGCDTDGRQEQHERRACQPPRRRNH